MGVAAERENGVPGSEVGEVGGVRAWSFGSLFDEVCVLTGVDMDEVVREAPSRDDMLRFLSFARVEMAHLDIDVELKAGLRNEMKKWKVGPRADLTEDKRKDFRVYMQRFNPAVNYLSSDYGKEVAALVLVGAGGMVDKALVEADSLGVSAGELLNEDFWGVVKSMAGWSVRSFG